MTTEVAAAPARRPPVALGTPAREPSLLAEVGPAVLAAAVGVDVLLAGLVLWRVPPQPPDLTAAGRANVFPEHDVVLYLSAGLLSLLLAVAFARRSGPSRSRPLVQVSVALAGLGLATGGFFWARPAVSGGWARLAYAGAAATVAAVCLLLLRPGRQGAGGGRSRPPAALPTASPRVFDGVGPGALDLVVALLVVAFLYTPSWRRLAGNAFSGEEFLHLDFFAMGPAHAFLRGAALGTDLYPYYGVGWAITLAALDGVYPLSYGNFVRLEVAYGCLYFIGLFALLRAFLPTRWLAIVGTFLAIVLQLFTIYPSSLVLWRFPSATVLRWAFDVWVFLLLVVHLRTRRPGWALLAAAVVGAAAVFQTETGLYLGAALAFHLVCRWREAPDPRRATRLFLAAGAMAAAVALLGLGIASRWTLGSGRFWTGWLQNLRAGSAGATLLPIARMPGTAAVVWFVVMTATYLAVGAVAVGQLVRGRLRPAVEVLGTVSVYGFLTLCYFVGRSHAFNLFRPSVPFAIVVIGCAGLVVERMRDRRALSSPGAGQLLWLRPVAAALVVTVVVAAGLAASPGARAYPGLVRSAMGAQVADGRCLFDAPHDICGLTPAYYEYAGHLHETAARVRALRGPTESFAVLDSSGPLLYLMTGAPTWGRYSPLFPDLFTQEQLRTVLDDLEHRPPEVIVMRDAEHHVTFYDDVWRAARVPVERDYVLDSRFGPLEVWVRR